MMGFVVSKPGDTHGSLRKDLHIPQPRQGEALVRVLRAGVCNTDLEILEGYMGFQGILGHEFVGIVEHVQVVDDDLSKKWMGKRVCGDINVGCFACGVCLNAPFDRDNSGCCPKFSRNHCPHRTVLGILNKNGTMAEYLTLPLRNLHVVPDHVSDAVAVFAEPLAAACRIVEQNLVRYLDERENEHKSGTWVPPDKVAILGDGKLGLMIAEVLGREHSIRVGNASVSDDDNNNKLLYPKPILFGKHSHKMDLVKGTSGVDCLPVSECIDATQSSFTGVSPKHEHAYDVVVDATGSPAGLKLAAGMCRPMGTLVLKSTCAAGLEQFNAAPFVIDELRVVGSRCGPIDRALELLAIIDDEDDNNNNIDTTTTTTTTTTATSTTNNTIQPLRVEKYITKIFLLEDVEAAIKCAAERSTMKVQIICSE
jgi:threonine dehydrogenase-like Zn-dependent dehydrogenase